MPEDDDREEEDNEEEDSESAESMPGRGCTLDFSSSFFSTASSSTGASSSSFFIRLNAEPSSYSSGTRSAFFSTSARSTCVVASAAGFSSGAVNSCNKRWRSWSSSTSMSAGFTPRLSSSISCFATSTSTRRLASRCFAAASGARFGRTVAPGRGA